MSATRRLMSPVFNDVLEKSSRLILPNFRLAPLSSGLPPPAVNVVSHISRERDKHRHGEWLTRIVAVAARIARACVPDNNGDRCEIFRDQYARRRQRTPETDRHSSCAPTHKTTMPLTCFERVASLRRRRRVAFKFVVVLGCALAVAFVVAVAGRLHATSARRVWAAGEPPVVFWTWREYAPSDEDVARAVRETRAQMLFMRAGQIDFDRGRLSRIRPVRGRFPRALPVHLVYNTTRALLPEFERIGEHALASVVSENFLKDSARASDDGARVAGLQLDIDVPTRLLARYGRTLHLLRAALPPHVSLSVTGLPTWMDSTELDAMLRAVDFWIPQFYGAEIPKRLDAPLPISSTAVVVAGVGRARSLGKPFYAGLPAYGHALLYDTGGALITLRGDIAPARVARDANFELVERRPFDAHGTSTASEWRYVYRARGAGIVDGLSVGAGDNLVFDVPGSASLGASVRGVREHAGEMLLGICIFCLPEQDDAATLTIQQIAAALAAADAPPAANLRLERTAPPASSAAASFGRADDAAAAFKRFLENQPPLNHLTLHATNTGTAGALMGDDALQLTLEVARGSVRGIVRLDGFTSVETLCGEAAAHDRSARAPERLRPCGMRRANVLRLKSPTWEAGAGALATISFETETPETLAVIARIKTDDGSTLEHAATVRVETRRQQTSPLSDDHHKP